MSASPPSPKTTAVSTQNDTPEPFPSLSDSPKSPARSNTENHDASRSRGQSSTSTLQERLRRASITFQESNPPTGMWIATGQIASSVPSLADIRRGSYGSEGWSGAGQVREKERRASLTRRGSSQSEVPTRKSSGGLHSPKGPVDIQHESVPEVADESEAQVLPVIPSGVVVDPSRSETNPSEIKVMETGSSGEKKKGHDERSSSDTNLTPKSTTAKTEPQHKTTPFDNGYQFPPKHTWQESTIIGLKAFWGFFITPIGFLVTIYGLNVVAWGGMLFLLLCNASPAMCYPTCNDINSPRRVWIEIDSQVLNSLFCVTGFGTIPWRFRDLYYLMQYRLQKKEVGLRRLAGINRGWFRLAGSQDLPVSLGPAEVEADASHVPESSIPFPINKIANAPLTGIRASPTKMWKLDFVIWAMVWNTFLQAVLSGFMWGYNRIERPSWSTGLFVALACIVAGAGGIMSFIEGKRVKTIEGVPVSEADQERLRRDRELGITHYNNINDEKPKEKKADEEKGLFKRKQKKEDSSIQVDESAIEDGVA
ncbi:hypothetical protein G7Y89_g14439 [Cudoniella acicularis]|uniref:Uncharacterized protein n=1 Tax=Cudoniella acicularis TaxID=354080 RepID=A0A8H4R1Z4_9HELO|nr:hypothetical protein G7Y89_g14439 [Cudoniella acicularis]